MSAFKRKVIKVMNKSSKLVMLVEEYDDCNRASVSEEILISTENYDRLRQVINEIKWWCGEEDVRVEMNYLGEIYMSCSEFVYRIYFELRRRDEVVNKKISYGY